MNLKNTLKEPSTYAGLALLIASVFQIAEDQAVTLVEAGAGIVMAFLSIAAILLPESPQNKE